MKGKINEDKVVNVVVYILLAFIGIVTLYPFYYTIICSFNDGLDLMKGGVYLWPRKFTLSNYELFIGDEGWRHAFFISVARTIVGTVLCTGFTSMFSYALSRNNLMFKKGYRFLVIFTMYFSGGLIPYYVLLRSLGLLNTFWVYVIPGMVNTFFVMTGINFFASIPESMIEAAKIDGANGVQRFFRIVLPYMKSVIKVTVSMSIIENFKQFPLFWTMTGGGPNNSTTTMAILSYREAFVSNNFGSGAAVTTVWMLMMIVVVYIYNRIFKSEDM